MGSKYLLIIGIILISGLNANHWEPAWWGQNPYMAMNVVVKNAEISGVPVGAGDEIGVFDGDLLVGAVLLTQPISDYPYDSVPIIVSINGGDVPGSATPGHFITLKLWSSNTEYSYPEMSVQFQYYYGSYNTTFSSLGTSFIEKISYSPPFGTNIQALTPPAGPGGGYVNNVSFPGTGVLLNQIWINANGGGEVTTYSFNTPSLDVSFSGAPPAYCSNFGWYLDASDISYYASVTYPIILSFNLAELGIINPETVSVYRRAIHGTGPFTAVTGSYNASTGFITVNVTAFGEFILGSNSPFVLPPVENLTIVKDEMTTRVLLSWTYDTPNVQFHIYQSTSPYGPFTLLNTVTLTHAYIYAPPDLAHRFFYVTAELTP